MLSFALPVLIVLAVIVARGIWPFGDNSFLCADLYHQYTPFMTEFRRKLVNGESLAYSWNLGLGADFFALYAYYLASPENWLVALVPERFVTEFIAFWIVVKIGLAGGAMGHYLIARFGRSDTRVVMYSLFYALCGFTCAYYYNTMWMNALCLAPLIILGLERLIGEGSWRLYTFTLAFVILTDYYIAMIVCIFLVLYCAVTLINERLSVRKMLTACLRFMGCSILAAGLACIVLVPVIASMMGTEFANPDWPKSLEWYMNPVEMFARHGMMVDSHRALDHWPNIYCGVLVFILVPMYLTHRAIPLRERIGRLFMMAVFFLAFATNWGSFVWHGFNYPDSLPARQSFLYCFLLVTMCYEAAMRSDENSTVSEIAGFALGGALLVACGLWGGDRDADITDEALICSWVFIVAYLVVRIAYESLARHSIRIGRPKTARMLVMASGVTVIALAAAELVCNTAASSIMCVSRDSYLNMQSAYEGVTQDVRRDAAPNMVRFDNRNYKTHNDGILGDYPSGNYFSSTMSAETNELYRRLGLRETKVTVDTRGINPLIQAILGIDYTITTDQLPTDLYTYRGSENGYRLYEHEYTLPWGFAVPDDNIDRYGQCDNLANGLQAALMEAPSSRCSAAPSNAIARLLTGQDLLVHVPENYLEAAPVEAGSLVFTPTVSGHFYAQVRNITGGDTVSVITDIATYRYDELRWGSLIDLGYCDAKEPVAITHELDDDAEDPALELTAYKLDELVLSDCIEALSSAPFVTTALSADRFTGEIDLDRAAHLFLPVIYNRGWRISVDGAPVAYDEGESLAGACVYIPLSSGHHEITMQYCIRGLGIGGAITAIAVLVTLLLIVRDRRTHNGSTFESNHHRFCI